MANTVAGLVCAIPELLESVGYEVLAMGPNWIYVPDGFRERFILPSVSQRSSVVLHSRIVTDKRTKLWCWYCV
ncbi:MAG UNVERIFIED_CONTAM: hypothetical protein LVR18_25500 [Planctomycetaceae bacterium]